MRHAWSSERAPAASDSLRRRNLSAILGHVHLNGATSRSELAAVTGLNRSTVGFLVADLAARGLVREVAPRASGAPGRPSPLVEPRHDRHAVLAAEVFADSIAVAIVGLGGVILSIERIERPRGYCSPAETVAWLAEIAAPLRCGAPPILAAGIAVAGLVRASDGVVASAPNLGWRDVPLAVLAREALGLDVEVSVGNDADLAALAEHTRGSGVGADDFVFVWGEVGVGAGIVADGRLLRGRSGYAGEVGHLPIDPNGRECHCGSRGCWETLIAEDAVLRAVGRGDAPGGGAALDDVLRAAAAGDREVCEGLVPIGNSIGVGLAALINVVNPERIALGGLFARIHPYVAEPVERQLDRWAMDAPRRDVEIVTARLGGDAPLIGAAELALGAVLADPTLVPAERPSLGPDHVSHGEEVVPAPRTG